MEGRSWGDQMMPIHISKPSAEARFVWAESDKPDIPFGAI